QAGQNSQWNHLSKLVTRRLRRSGVANRFTTCNPGNAQSRPNNNIQATLRNAPTQSNALVPMTCTTARIKTVQTNDAIPVVRRKPFSGSRRKPAARYVGNRAPGSRRLKIRIQLPLLANQCSLCSTRVEKRLRDVFSNQLRPTTRANPYRPASPIQIPK